MLRQQNGKNRVVSDAPGIRGLTFAAGVYIMKYGRQEAGSVCRSTRAELIYLIKNGNVMYAFEGIRFLLKKTGMPFFISTEREQVRQAEDHSDELMIQPANCVGAS